MHPRIVIAKIFLKLGRFIQSAAVVVMRPNELVEFSRLHYAKPNAVQGWGDEQFVNSGLNPQEQALLDKTNMHQGQLLLLGLGGGREAIPMAKMGFAVTGVDFIPEMVERAKENAKKNGVEINGLVQEISQLDMPEQSFDLAWLSAAMYSCVPTRKKRLDMLKRIGQTLKPGSCFVLGFLWNPKGLVSRNNSLFKKIVAWSTWGNLHYEDGDTLRFDREFMHAFLRIEDFKSEIIQGGFVLLDIQASDESEFAGAVVRKPA
jgi:SAM-dependent methyltransferase